MALLAKSVSRKKSFQVSVKEKILCFQDFKLYSTFSMKIRAKNISESTESLSKQSNVSNENSFRAAI